MCHPYNVVIPWTGDTTNLRMTRNNLKKVNIKKKFFGCHDNKKQSLLRKLRKENTILRCYDDFCCTKKIIESNTSLYQSKPLLQWSSQILHNLSRPKRHEQKPTYCVSH